jgi:hypothetical protein
MSGCLQKTVRAMTLAFASLAGCDTHAPGQAGASLSSSSPLTWIGAIGLGTPQEPNRGVGVERARFTAGELIQLRVDVSGAPAAAQISVDWLDSRVRTLGNQVKVTRVGERILTFDSPRALPPGTYAVRMRVDGQLAQEREFEIRPKVES